MDCTDWRFSKLFYDTSKLSQKNYLQQLHLWTTYFINTRVIITDLSQMVVECITHGEKTIIEVSINGAAYNWVLQQFKLAFSWIQCRHNEIYNNKLCPFQEKWVTVKNASLKENVQSHFNWNDFVTKYSYHFIILMKISWLGKLVNGYFMIKYVDDQRTDFIL